MTPFDIVCIVAGTWIVAAAVLSVPVGRAIRGGQQPAQPAQAPEPDADWLAPWPSDSPFDLAGYELDARFYAVVAPSFREYR